MGYVDNLVTNKIMNKYGVAWFGFDEVSGNVYDKLGNNHIGTVYAGATRVAGWDGEGYAMNFNRTSTSYIQFDTKVIPNGNYTLKFKMKLIAKPTAENQEVFSNGYATADHAGLRIWINTAGHITFASLRKSSGNYDFATSFVASFDNKWHDYMLSFDATNKTVKTYMDNILMTKLNTTTQNTLIASYNLRIGRQVVSAEARYFNGQLDEIEVYNKALSPSDFNLCQSLILDNGEYKSYNNSSWSNVSATKPTIEQFINDGMDSISPLLDRINEESPVDELSRNYKIVTWTNTPNAKLLLESPTPAQVIYPTKDISLFGTESIDNFILTATGNVKIAISFDSGLTWKAYKNGLWEVVNNAHSGMTISEINASTSQQIEECRGGSQFIRFSYSLSGDAEVDNIQMKVSMQGSEKITDSADYDLSYDEQNKTIVYNIKKSGAYSVNYVS